MSNRYRNRRKGEKEEIRIRKQRFKRVIFYRYNQHLGRGQSQYFSLRDFDLSQKEGKGPLGETYSVQYQGKSCILKEISREQMKKLGVTKHMIYQTSIAKKLKHPFLLKLYAVFEDDQSMYFICERCTETYADLMKYMNRNKTNFTINEIRRTAAQLLLLIEYFRSKKTVLKGIHPANILLNKDGFIRMKEPGVFNTRKYLYWMPPEHLKNGKFTKESDIWTFGVFIYWMLTQGNIPYPRIYTVHMLLMKMRLNKIKWPKKSATGEHRKVDPVAKDFVCKLLAFRPRGRLGSGKKGLQKLKNHKFVREELENVKKEILRNQFAEIAAKDMKERCRSLCEIDSLRGDFSIQLKNRWFRYKNGQDVSSSPLIFRPREYFKNKTKNSKKEEEEEEIEEEGEEEEEEEEEGIDDDDDVDGFVQSSSSSCSNDSDSSKDHQVSFFCNSSCFKRKQRERLKLLGYEGENELSFIEEEGGGEAKAQLGKRKRKESDKFFCMNNEIRIWKSILLHL